MTAGYTLKSKNAAVRDPVWVYYTPLESKKPGSARTQLCLHDETKVWLPDIDYSTVPEKIAEKARGRKISQNSQNTFIKYALPTWTEAGNVVRERPDQDTTTTVGLTRQNIAPTTPVSSAKITKAKGKAGKLSAAEAKTMLHRFKHLKSDDVLDTNTLERIQRALADRNPKGEMPTIQLLLDAVEFLPLPSPLSSLLPQSVISIHQLTLSRPLCPSAFRSPTINKIKGAHTHRTLTTSIRI